MRQVIVSLVCGLLVLSGSCQAANILSNGSFESNYASWVRDSSYTTQVTSSYSGVTALAGNGSKFFVLIGPAPVGYTYAAIISQSKSAPFGGDVPSSVTDNFIVYLSAYTYLHTNPGRSISFAVTVEPGYGLMSSTFYRGTKDAWVLAKTSGYYRARDPFDASLPVKPIKVTLELRDSLQSGEFLLLDNVLLEYGGPGLPEVAATSLSALAGRLM